MRSVVTLIALAAIAGCTTPTATPTEAANITHIPVINTPVVQAEPSSILSTSTPNPADTIQRGETVSGPVDVDAEQDVWTFSGQAGEWVSLDLLTGYHAYTLCLYDPQGTPVDCAPSGSGRWDGRLLTAQLPTSGTYNVVISDLWGFAPYTLTLQSRLSWSQEAAKTTTPIPLTPQQPYENNFTSLTHTYDISNLDQQATYAVVVAPHSPSLDPTITVDGRMTNAAGANAIETATFTALDELVINVSARGMGTGAYTIEIFEVSQKPFTTYTRRERVSSSYDYSFDVDTFGSQHTVIIPLNVVEEGIFGWTSHADVQFYTWDGNPLSSANNEVTFTTRGFYKATLRTDSASANLDLTSLRPEVEQTLQMGERTVVTIGPPDSPRTTLVLPITEGQPTVLTIDYLEGTPYIQTYINGLQVGYSPYLTRDGRIMDLFTSSGSGNMIFELFDQGTFAITAEPAPPHVKTLWPFFSDGSYVDTYTTTYSGDLAVGSSQIGTITRADHRHRYTITGGEVGQVITVRVQAQSGDLIPWANLRSGNRDATLDHGLFTDPTPNADLIITTIDADEQTIIDLGGFYTSLGNYTITVEAGIIGPDVVDMGTLPTARLQSAELASGTIHRWQIPANPTGTFTLYDSTTIYDATSFIITPDGMPTDINDPQAQVFILPEVLGQPISYGAGLLIDGTQSIDHGTLNGDQDIQPSGPYQTHTWHISNPTDHDQLVWVEGLTAYDGWQPIPQLVEDAPCLGMHTPRLTILPANTENTCIRVRIQDGERPMYIRVHKTSVPTITQTLTPQIPASIAENIVTPFTAHSYIVTGESFTLGTTRSTPPFIALLMDEGDTIHTAYEHNEGSEVTRTVLRAPQDGAYRLIIFTRAPGRYVFRLTQ